MSDGLNQATLIGNLGADPDLRTTQGGTAVMALRLATSKTYLDKDKQKQERTEWHRIVVWGRRAEGLAKILNKGDRICVVGEIRTSTYEDKDKVTRYSTEIVCSNVVLCGGARKGNGPPHPAESEDLDIPVTTADDDDIPF